MIFWQRAERESVWYFTDLAAFILVEAAKFIVVKTPPMYNYSSCIPPLLRATAMECNQRHVPSGGLFFKPNLFSLVATKQYTLTHTKQAPLPVSPFP